MMQWSHQYIICVEYQPLARGALTMTFSNVILILSCVDAAEAVFYASKRSLIATKSFIMDLSICAICAGTSHDPEGAR